MISTLTQTFGIAIVLLALGQVFVIIKEMIMSLAAAKRQTELELDVLKLKAARSTSNHTTVDRSLLSIRGNI